VIILDTNVLSEAFKPQPAESVLGWLATQAPSAVFTTTITLAEILNGIETLPPGRRRIRLSAAVEAMFRDQFEGRILAFDEDAARQYSRIAATRARVGRPISQFDAMIAAIARLHRAAVATRDTADFEHCGVETIDPWVR